MTPAQTSTADPVALPEGIQGIVADWSSDQRAFKNVPWGKAMMWIFLLSATFVGMQAFEWTKLIFDEGIRPWGNPLGAAQFGAAFFMITGFHGTHVSIGVIFLLIVATKVLRGDLDHERPGFLTGRKGKYEIVEIMGLYWHFVDLVWVFIFAVFYLW